MAQLLPYWTSSISEGPCHILRGWRVEQVTERPPTAAHGRLSRVGAPRLYPPLPPRSGAGRSYRGIKTTWGRLLPPTPRPATCRLSSPLLLTHAQHAMGPRHPHRSRFPVLIQRSPGAKPDRQLSRLTPATIPLAMWTPRTPSPGLRSGSPLHSCPRRRVFTADPEAGIPPGIAHTLACGGRLDVRPPLRLRHDRTVLLEAWPALAGGETPVRTSEADAQTFQPPGRVGLANPWRVRRRTQAISEPSGLPIRSDTA